MFNTFYNVIAPVALITVLSFLVGRRFTIDTRSLSKVVIYLATPALVFDRISKSTLQAGDLGELALVGGLTMLTMTVIGWLIGHSLRLEGKLGSAIILAAAFANAGNYGIPLNSFAFGDEGVSRAIIIFMTLNFLYNTVGIFLASGGSHSAKEALLNVLRVPNPYAALVGIMVNVGLFQVPLPVERGLALLGEASLPTMIIILGIQLAKTELRGRLPLISLAAGVRLIIAPLVSLGLVTLLGISGINASVIMLQTSMPTAVLSIVYAEEFGSEAEFLSGVVLISTLGSFVTLSLLLNFLG